MTAPGAAPDPAADRRAERDDRPGAAVPGSPTPGDAGPAPAEEPTVTGALFLSMVLLMLIAGAWIVMFQRLVGR